jgi:hypothetical protein
MRARRDGNDWMKGEWGLVECNDPTYIWKKTPTPSPVWGMTDDEEEIFINGLTKDDPRRDRALGLNQAAFSESFYGTPEQGHRLIEAAKTVGFDREKHGSFTYWFFDYLGEYLKTAVMVDEGDPFPKREEFAPVDLTIGRDPIPGEDDEANNR